MLIKRWLNQITVSAQNENLHNVNSVSNHSKVGGGLSYLIPANTAAKSNWIDPNRERRHALPSNQKLIPFHDVNQADQTVLTTTCIDFMQSYKIWSSFTNQKKHAAKKVRVYQKFKKCKINFGIAQWIMDG